MKRAFNQFFPVQFSLKKKITKVFSKTTKQHDRDHSASPEEQRSPLGKLRNPRSGNLLSCF